MVEIDARWAVSHPQVPVFAAYVKWDSVSNGAFRELGLHCAPSARRRACPRFCQGMGVWGQKRGHSFSGRAPILGGAIRYVTISNRLGTQL